jgi:uncharacterized membrane protein
MTIDYLPMMLINTAAALVVAATFMLKGIVSENPRPWIAGFVMTGTVALLGGLHMCFTWPLSYRWANVAFGEPSVMLGIVLLGTALALTKSWQLWPVGVYALLAGLAVIAVGLKIYAENLTKMPAMTTAGFVLAGVAGVLTLPIFLCPKRCKELRILAAALMLISATIWMATALPAFWMHVSPKAFAS